MIIIIIIIIIWEFFTPRWSSSAVLVRASLLKYPGLFLGFWPISTILSFDGLNSPFYF